MAQNAGAPILGRGHVDKFERAYNGDPKSALFNVLGIATLGNLPPTFVQVCGMDPLRDEALVYVQELKRNGVETDLKVYNGVSHGFWSVFPKWEKSKGFVRDTVNGMKWLLTSTNKG
jgi:acetyl esterase/lipase